MRDRASKLEQRERIAAGRLDHAADELG